MLQDLALRSDQTQAIVQLPLVCKCVCSKARVNHSRLWHSWPINKRCLCRRFKEALAQPFWTELDDETAARLHRALEQGVHPVLCMSSALAWETQWCLTATRDGADSGLYKEATAWLAAQRASFVALELGSVQRCALLQGRLDAQCATFLSLLLGTEDVSGMQLAPSSGPSAAQVHTISLASLRACSSRTSLQLSCTQWLPELPEQPLKLLEQLPDALPQLFGSMTSLLSLDLTVMVFPFQFQVGLEAFVSALMPLKRLHSLSLSTESTDAVSVLPACITALASLREFKLDGSVRVACAPGWADMPKLEVLHLSVFDIEGGADQAFEGIVSLLSLSELVFTGVRPLTSWPSALTRLARLQMLHHSVLGYDGQEVLPCTPPPLTWSQLQGLQDLTLGDQRYNAFPAVLTHLTALSRLGLEGNCFMGLPAGITALTSLVELALGHPPVW